MRTLFAAMLFAVSLSAQADDWRQRVSITDTQFDQYARIEGLSGTSGNYYGHPAREWQLMTLLDKKTGAATHVLYFSDTYDGSGWRFWRSASTDKAETLKLEYKKRSVGSCSRYSGCSHYETVAFAIPAEVMQRGSLEGLNLRLSADGDQEIIRLEAIEFADQLAATEATRQRITKR